MSQSVKFLGKGWSFPIQVDGSGTIAYKEGKDNIEQSLKILLMTALGERVMRSEYGNQAPDLVFSPGSVQYLKLLEKSIEDAIIRWEPRVIINEVIAESVDGEENRVIVNIAYTIRGSNARDNLVFPFYVGLMEDVF